ncbi:hypothetical protein C5167_000918 [Papaver somniferum]|uniref:Uncharacterized protein n=1 Tax=Papaver somniferum TaxID=3469 RepID=A0A4Y7KTX3_PAPSO|nr:hypothetical protein C5167_000918 [Papaver somniferum]
MKPDKTLKPKFDFFNSRGLYGLDLANFISNDPLILRQSFNTGIIPSFDILKSILQSDQNVIKMIMQFVRVRISIVKALMVNVKLLRCEEGVPENNIRKHLIKKPGSFMLDSKRFVKIVRKVKESGFDPSYTFRKNPQFMMVSEKKIMAIMNFLVNEMGYDSSIVAEYPKVFNHRLKERIIPRCSVIRILVFRGLIKENISIGTFSTMVDKSFLEKFVIKYEQEVPELMKIFQGVFNGARKGTGKETRNVQCLPTAVQWPPELGAS